MDFRYLDDKFSGICGFLLCEDPNSVSFAYNFYSQVTGTKWDMHLGNMNQTALNCLTFYHKYVLAALEKWWNWPGPLFCTTCYHAKFHCKFIFYVLFKLASSRYPLTVIKKIGTHLWFKKVMIIIFKLENVCTKRWMKNVWNASSWHFVRYLQKHKMNVRGCHF